MYACNYQSKVLIAGTFTALSLMVATNVQKLSFLRCCKCYSCDAAMFYSPIVWIGYQRQISYDGILRLREVEDFLLLMFERGLHENRLLFDRGRMQSHEDQHSEVVLLKKKHSKMILH